MPTYVPRVSGVKSGQTGGNCSGAQADQVIVPGGGGVA